MSDPELDRVVAKLCLLREAGGESVAVKNAIWHVILNRVNDPAGRWPKTVHEVVTQHGQFSSFSANDPNVTRWPSEKNDAEWTAWIDCGAVVTSALLADPTNGANSYHSIPDTGYHYKGANGQDITLMPPAWADPVKLTLQLGKTKFYKL
jgi:hypothetical protein